MSLIISKHFPRVSSHNCDRFQLLTVLIPYFLTLLPALSMSERELKSHIRDLSRPFRGQSLYNKESDIEKDETGRSLLRENGVSELESLKSV